jgi:hypothetical protein
MKQNYQYRAENKPWGHDSDNRRRLRRNYPVIPLAKAQRTPNKDQFQPSY